MIMVKAFITRDFGRNNFAQIGNDCAESNCSVQLPSNLSRCSHFWAFKKADVLRGRVW